MSEKLIGIDVGGTSARVARFDDPESDAVSAQKDFAVADDYEKDLAEFIATIQEVTGGEPVAGIGLASAGTLDYDRRVLIESPNVQSWKERPLLADLEKALGCEVKWINDTAAAALAEAVHGKARSEDFWFFGWGTGIGVALVEFRDGVPYPIDSEAGHVILNWDDPEAPLCGCGKRGCLEAYAGGGNIPQRFAGETAADLSGPEWEDVSIWVARGLYDILRTVPTDPEHPESVVVFGGGITFKQPQCIPVIEANLNELLKGWRKARIELAKHDDNGGVVGAMAAARRQS